jgi:hypothetical protein
MNPHQSSSLDGKGVPAHFGILLIYIGPLHVARWFAS